jgi:hypothetical protein
MAGSQRISSLDRRSVTHRRSAISHVDHTLPEAGQRQPSPRPCCSFHPFLAARITRKKPSKRKAFPPAPALESVKFDVAGTRPRRRTGRQAPSLQVAMCIPCMHARAHASCLILVRVYSSHRSSWRERAPDQLFECRYGKTIMPFARPLCLFAALPFHSFELFSFRPEQKGVKR